jgi:formylglycine-generating enzyme
VDATRCPGNSMQKYAVPLLALVGLSQASCARASAEEGTTYADAGVRTTLAVAVTDRTPTPVVAPKRRDDSCPDGMVLVEGEYCPDVEQRCLEWMDPPGTPYEHFRCKRYAQPAVCHGKRVHKRFCIDAVERKEQTSDLPRNHLSWTASTELCKEAGARLCKTSEWQFACEGEEMRPYPYGWERDPTACNVDVMTGLGKVGRLVDHRTPASAHPRCVSPFGVHDMAGNVDEWATVDGLPQGKREVMKGSWWLPGRHACRSGQGGHGAWYGGTESGARCCTDPSPPNEIAPK